MFFEELTRVVFDCRIVLFSDAFCPDDTFVPVLPETVLTDLLLFTVLRSEDGFETDLLVTEVDDLLIVPLFCPDDGFFTDFSVTVVFDLLFVVVRLSDILLY
jgi:hypothetical protein